MSLGIVFLSEVFGTAMLTLLGCGVVANVALKGTKGNNGGFLMVTWGWGIAVFSGVYVAAMSGAHLNPAVTFGLLLNGKTEYAPGVPVDFASTLTYFGGELLGAFLGRRGDVAGLQAALRRFEPEPASQLAVFSTGPAIRSTPWNLITEIIGTFVLVFVILTFGGTPSGLGPLAVALLVVGIGVSLGGPTGYAINPARDLGPRIAHALLPMKGKGSSRLELLLDPGRRTAGRRRPRRPRRSSRADHRHRSRLTTHHALIQLPAQDKDVNMNQYVIAIDQGTTSTRAIVFDHSGNIVSSGQMEHEQIFPQAGWVEHDPAEIWNNTREVIASALSKANLTRHDIAAVGITNQRETAVVWDKTTGKAIYNAIVWQDTRTQPIVDELAKDGGPERFKQKVGLPLATYFSGTKIKWILDNVEGARAKAEAGDLVFGNTDCWVLWNLTGGVDGGVHVTDVTNASRTMFMDLETLSWDQEILDAFGVPASMMPAIKSSSEVYGTVHTSQLLREVPVAGILGDQQAATFGQAAFDAGEAKNTYGTGLLPHLQHRRGNRPLQERAADHGRLQARRRRTALRAGRLHRRHRFADPVAA